MKGDSEKKINKSNSTLSHVINKTNLCRSIFREKKVQQRKSRSELAKVRISKYEEINYRI